MRSLYFQGNKSKPHHLVDSEDIIIIRTHKNKKIQQCRFNNKELQAKVGSELKELDYYPEANVGVYKILPKDGISDPKYRDELRALLKKESKHIKYAGRILKFQDANIYQIYTENIFVKFQDSISPIYCEEIIRNNNSIKKIKSKLGFCKNGYFIEAKDNIGQNVFNLAEDILDHPYTELCHPELVLKRKSFLKRFDDYYRNPDLSFNWALEKINIQKAWKKSKGEGVKICIIDDGIDVNHPAFNNRIYKSKDMLSISDNKQADHKFDSEMHGTACASIACANDQNFKGVAPDAQLIPIRSKGLGSVLESEAFYWAVNRGADIISCSWGPPDGDIYDPTDNLINYPIPDHTRLAIEYATTQGRKGKGAIVLFAAGNGKEPIKFDGYASHPNVLAIGASNKKDQSTIYSDYGSPIFCVFPSGDYTRNGQNQFEKEYGIMTADRLGSAGLSKGDYFDLFDGTSASSPGMAGVIALMLSVAPNLTRLQIKEILKSSCIKIGEASSYSIKGGKPYHPQFGYGLIDADLAIKNVHNFQKININKIMKPKKVYALHIGINVVSDLEYGNNAIPDLSGCVNDMNNMANLVINKYDKEQLVKPTLLYSEDGTEADDILPTTQNIKSTLTSYATKMEAGDFLIITYAGHGAPIPDENGDEEDGNDEAWVCYDDFLLDDEANKLFSLFKEGTKILVISDSCHSGTTTRALKYNRLNKNESKQIRYVPLSVVNKIKNRNQIKERVTSINKTRGAFTDNNLGQLATDLILMAACDDSEFAQEENDEGVFSKRIRETYMARPDLSYVDLIKEIQKNMPSSQNPKLYLKDNDDSIFLGSSFLASDSGINTSVSTTKLTKSSQTESSTTSICNSIYVSTKNNETIHVKLDSNKRSTNYISETKIRNNQTPINNISGTNPWDKAYALLNQMSEEELKKINYIEPNIISDLYFDEEHRETEERKITELTKDGYLPTYPNPKEDKNCLNPFIWHLDENHSQLREAFLSIHQNDYDNDMVPDMSKVTTIGHIDTGVYMDHDTLPVNFDSKKSGTNITDYDTLNPAEQQGHGHGTISILAGNKFKTVNTEDRFDDYYGAHPFAHVISYKISDSVALLFAKNFKNAIQKAIEDGCRVITMSMAGWPSQLMAEAVNMAYEEGVVLVTAGSNNFVKGFGKVLPKKLLYPARWDRVIAAVGATYDDTPYLFKDQERNKKKRAAGGIYMQMCYGPRESEKTTMAAYSPNLIWFGEFEKENKEDKRYVRTGGGTSSCAPQIAAAAALYIEKYRDELETYIGDEKWIRAEIVRQALFHSAKEIPKYKKKFGQGILQAKTLLSDKFRPEKIIEKTSFKKQKVAAIPTNLFKKLFTIFGSRSGSKSMSIKKQMLNNELFQLMHKEPGLQKFLNRNIQKPILGDEKKQFIEAVFNSTLASQELKLNLGAKGSGINLSRGVSADSIELIQSKNTDIRLRGEKVKIRTISEESQLHEGPIQFETVTIETEVTASNSRNLLGSKVSIEAIDTSGLEDFQFGIFTVVEFEGNEIIKWNFEEFSDKVRSKNRNVGFQNGQVTIDLHKLLKAELVKTRGDKGKKIIKIISTVIKWTFNQDQGPEEVVNAIAAQENRFVIFSVENNSWNPYSSLNEKEQNEFKTWLNKKTEKLLVFHGLASSCEDGFQKYFTEYPEAIKKYGKFILGFDMADVVQSVSKNAKVCANILNGLLTSKQNITILTRSRGGLVARQLIENGLVENLKLKKLIQLAPPNQGTPIARDKFYENLFNVLSYIPASTKSVPGILLSKAIQVYKHLAGQIISLPGIDDLEEGSKFIKKLNNKELNFEKYYVIVTNFKPTKKDGRLKQVFDKLIFDTAIFTGQKNDGVVPFKGATFENKNRVIPTFSNNKKSLQKSRITKIENSNIFHTKYLESDNNAVKNKLTKLLKSN